VRKVSIENVECGTKIAKNVISSDGTVLLAAGMLMQNEYKRRLNANGITDLFIEDDISSGIEIPDVVKQEIRTEAKALIKDMVNKTTIPVNINSSKVLELVEKIIESILSNDQIIFSLSDIRSVDDYTFEHSINVCIISLIIGMSIDLDENKLKELGVGSLLHDIGKLFINDEILKKPDKLTFDEFEQIKKHSVYGFDILKSNNDIAMSSAYIALGHHERVDGSGYPMKLKGDNIHQSARIVAIADVYDALTSERVYRTRQKPHEVVDYIVSLSGKQFDEELVNAFVRCIAHYPIGSGVVLSSNERGIVTRFNKSIPNRPVVRVVIDENGEMLVKHKELDLSENNSLYIVDVWEM